MDAFEKINDTIFNWDNNFDKLVKHFTNEDYGIILDKANWRDNYDCAVEVYSSGDWSDLLYFYITLLLMDCIDMGVKYGTENLFRLWFECL